MPLDFLAATITRWVGYFALAALIGSLTVDLLVLPDDAPELRSGRRRLQRLRAACILVLSLASVAEVILRGRTMTGAGFAAVLNAVPVILRRTHFGQVWLVRFALLAGALCSTFSLRRVARAATLVAAGGVAFTTAVTGHAGDWGDVSLSAAIDWVHVVASSSWVGGLFSLALVGRGGVVVTWPPTIFETIARRFSRMAGWSLLAVVLSGSYNAWVQVRMPAGMWETAYGRLLFTKLVIVSVLIWLGAVSRYTIVARLGDGHAAGLVARLFRLPWLALSGAREIAPALLPSRLLSYVSREACLGIIVLACTAILADSTPARHAVHLKHHATSAAPQITLEELPSQSRTPMAHTASHSCSPGGDSSQDALGQLNANHSPSPPCVRGRGRQRED